MRRMCALGLEQRLTLLKDEPKKIKPVAQVATDTNGNRGLAIAVIIMAVWFTSLTALLRSGSQPPPLVLLLAVFWQTFLYAGLFITAHDAMHNCVAPQHPRLNHGIGLMALLCYGWLPYRKLRKAHWQHHEYPASERDPDFHDGNTHWLLWYARFMRRYWGWWQFLAITVTATAIERDKDKLRIAKPASW